MHNVLVLCYHAVSNGWASHMAVKTAELEHQVKTLLDRGYTAATFSTALSAAASGAFVDWLREAGFAGDADTKRVPDWVFKLPQSQKRAFIDGYIAADGHVREGHRNVSLASVSLELLRLVKALAISAGMNPTKISTWTARHKLPLGKDYRQDIPAMIKAALALGGELHNELRAPMTRAASRPSNRLRALCRSLA